MGVIVALVFAGGVSAGLVSHGSTGPAGLNAVAIRHQAAAAPDTSVVLPLDTAPPTTVAPPTTSTAPPLPPPAAPTVTAAPPTTSGPLQPATVSELIADAMARIHYPWQQLGYRINFLGPRPDVQGRTSPRWMGFIDIFVRPDDSVDELAHVIAHEIGHAVDLVYNNDQRRTAWEDLRGISPRPWFTCSMCDDFSVPAGDFAETFAYWQIGDYSRSRLAPAPTPQELGQLTPFFSA